MIKEFLKYAVPSALAMFVSSLYTIIDGIFVGQGVGDSALAAVNIVMPFTIMLFGVATMFAVGGGDLVSKNIGSNNKEKAVNIFRQVFKLLLILSIGVSLISVIFSKYIVKILGATDTLIPLASTYLRYYSLFCIPNLIGIALNSFVRNDGRPKIAMISILAGAVTNIVLDYIFIFPLQFGIKGAAIATGLGQVVTIGILLPHFIRKKGILTFGNIKLEKKTIKEFVNIGFPSFFAEVSFSIIIFFMNVVLVNYGGEKSLSAFAIINYITTNIYMVLLGLSLGVQPLLSYNYGAKKSDKMLKFYSLTLKAAVIVNIVFISICFIFGKGMISIFTSDATIANISYIGLNLINIGFVMVGFNLTSTVYYQAINMPKISNIFCLCRSIILLPLILFILSKLLGINGIWISLLVSELLTFIILRYSINIKSYTVKAIEKCKLT
ncbi:MATE family efflux transporter [Clostridium celatum]|uniref:MATE family efflux transporter n=1 Tax=Clostridium celatum TaxID=36834 RepID=UPI001898D3B9|nr:MATE family efflux transporter [Clostridium celatum]MCE9655822.1 MATE family efflux transporter [Clostridium celatum]